MQLRIFIIALAFTTNGCKMPMPADSLLIRNDSIKYAPIPKERDDKYEWKPEWNVHIADAIDNFGSMLLHNDSVPLADIEKLCPNFKTATSQQKKAFWALFFASVAKYESNFDSTSRYRENASLNYVYSEGLLQLSYTDKANYPQSPIDTAKKNILDARVNLTTGVIIMVKQIKKRGVLFTDRHFYWSVLTNKQAEIITFFKKYSGGLGFCN